MNGAYCQGLPGGEKAVFLEWFFFIILFIYFL